VATEFGLPFWTNKTRDYACQPLPGNQRNDPFTDDTLWSAHPLDEGALAVFLGRVPVTEALGMAQRTYAMYATALRDPFDVRDVGIVLGDGPNGAAGVRPYCNSHYTRHLLGLHALPMALSGQRYDAGTGVLSFHPRRDGAGRPTAWPFFTPGGSGIVHELDPTDNPGATCVRLEVLAGEVALRELRIDGTQRRFRSGGTRTVLDAQSPADAGVACSANPG
jgi:hypothetical protein